MRDENIFRLNTHEIPQNNIHYLVYRSFHNELFDCLRKYARGRLLDIGCGNKPYEDILNPLVQEYIGCDIVQSSDQKTDIICDATNIPIPDASVDTIISTQVIEHIADHQLMINESFRILKEGGCIIISGPMYWPIHEEPFDFFRFTKYGFNHILKKSGFTVIEERSNGGKWALCGQAFIHALYPLLDNRTSFRWKLINKIFNLFGGIKSINKIFALLDDKFPDSSNTMNYVFVAQKNT